mmetsp:Transcript_69554/g.192495  ORF Transcript_69554/g.192495 Transcript_69554/m.192495 type:complete len:81 (+) Transcript_69554:7-249(+)
MTLCIYIYMAPHTIPSSPTRLHHIMDICLLRDHLLGDVFADAPLAGIHPRPARNAESPDVAEVLDHMHQLILVWATADTT